MAGVLLWGVDGALAAASANWSDFTSKLNESIRTVVSGLDLVNPLLRYRSSFDSLLPGSANTDHSAQKLLNSSISELRELEEDLGRMGNLTNEMAGRLPKEPTPAQLQQLNRSLELDLLKASHFREHFQAAFQGFAQAASAQGLAQRSIAPVLHTTAAVADRVYLAFRALVAGVRAGLPARATMEDAATQPLETRRDVSMPSNRSRQEGTQTELDVGSLLEGLDQEKQALQRTIRRDLDAQAHQEASEHTRVQTAMSSEAGAFASNLHRDLDKLVGAAARNGEVAAKEAAKAEVAAKEAARAEKQAEKDAIKAEKQDARQEASEEQKAQQAIERKVDAVADAADQKFADVERQEIAGRKDLQVALRRRASEKSHFHWPVAIMVVLLLLLVSRARRNRQSQLSPSACTVVEPLLGESRHPDDVVRERLDLEHKVAAQDRKSVV